MNSPFAEQQEWLPERVFVIAEAGVNHNGNLKLAEQLVDIAAEARADAVKFQTFKTEQLVTPHAQKAEYQTGGVDDRQTQAQMLRALELSLEAHQQLFKRCQDKGILFLSTPFERQSADFLDALGVKFLKIGSGEITDLALLEHIAAKGKPIILSTGMSMLGEVESAVNTIIQNGNSQLALLHCVSHYPAEPAEVNLRAMQTLKTAFGLPVGYSDHTLGIETALAATALGARVIEKHFTIDRGLPGPDQKSSAEPDELRALVRGVRKVEACLGDGRKQPAPSELETAAVARKSLVAARDLAAGAALTREMISMKRPGTGLAPALLSCVQGRRLRGALKAGDLIRLDNLE